MSVSKDMVVSLNTCKLFGWNINGVRGRCQSVAFFRPSLNLTLLGARAFLGRILIQWSCNTKCREDLRIPHTPHLCENINACGACISRGLASHALELGEGRKQVSWREGEAQALPGLHGWCHLCLGRGEHKQGQRAVGFIRMRYRTYWCLTGLLQHWLDVAVCLWYLLRAIPALGRNLRRIEHSKALIWVLRTVLPHISHSHLCPFFIFGW